MPTKDNQTARAIPAGGQPRERWTRMLDLAARTPSAAKFLILAALLAALPAAIWIDTATTTVEALEREARNFDAVISSIRAYYASDVVARVLSVEGKNVSVIHNYLETPGAIRSPRRCRWRWAASSPPGRSRCAIASAPTIPSPIVNPFRWTSSRRKALRRCGVPRPAGDRAAHGRRHFRRALHDAGDDVAGLRGVPQFASRKPQARLESRRCARLPGNHRRASDHPGFVVVPLDVDLYRRRHGDRLADVAGPDRRAPARRSDARGFGRAARTHARRGRTAAQGAGFGRAVVANRGSRRRIGGRDPLYGERNIARLERSRGADGAPGIGAPGKRSRRWPKSRRPCR